MKVTNGKKITKYRFRIKDDGLREEWKNTISNILNGIDNPVLNVKQSRTSDTGDVLDTKLDDNINADDTDVDLNISESMDNEENIIVQNNTTQGRINEANHDEIYNGGVNMSLVKLKLILKIQYGYDRKFVNQAMVKYTQLYGENYNMDIVLDYLELQRTQVNVNGNVTNVDDHKEDINRQELLTFVKNNKTHDIQVQMIKDALKIMDTNKGPKNTKNILECYNELKGVYNDNKLLMEELFKHADRIVGDNSIENNNIQQLIPPIFDVDEYKDIISNNADDNENNYNNNNNNNPNNNNNNTNNDNNNANINNDSNDNNDHKNDNSDNNDDTTSFEAKQLINWSEDDVKNWLLSLPPGLCNKFSVISDEHQMNGAQLMQLDELQLSEMLSNKILRKKLKKELTKYGYESTIDDTITDNTSRKPSSTKSNKKSNKKSKKKPHKKSSFASKNISEWNKKDVSKWLDSLPKQLKKAKEPIVNDYRMNGKKLIKTCQNDDQWSMVVGNAIIRKSLRKRVLKLKNDEDNQETSTDDTDSNDDSDDDSDGSDSDLEQKLKKMNDKDAVKALLKAKYNTKSNDDSFMFNVDTGKNVKFTHPCNKNTTIKEIKTILYESNFGDKVDNIELKYKNKTLKNNQKLKHVGITNNRHLIKAYFKISGAKR